MYFTESITIVIAGVLLASMVYSLGLVAPLSTGTKSTLEVGDNGLQRWYREIVELALAVTTSISISLFLRFIKTIL